MRRRFLGAVMALAAAAGAAAPVSAAIISFTYDSRITDGIDQSGLFGAPMGNLAGDAIEAVFTFDTTLGERITVPGVSDTLLGGAGVMGMPSSPLVSATLTINGHTVSIGGTLVGAAITTAGQSTAAEAVESDLTFIDAFAYTKDAPASLDTSFSPMGDVAGSFNIDRIGALSGLPETANADFSIPEPQTWAMMLMGLGGIGAVTRAARRRDAASVA